MTQQEFQERMEATLSSLTNQTRNQLRESLRNLGNASPETGGRRDITDLPRTLPADPGMKVFDMKPVPLPAKPNTSVVGGAAQSVPPMAGSETFIVDRNGTLQNWIFQATYDSDV